MGKLREVPLLLTHSAAWESGVVTTLRLLKGMRQQSAAWESGVVTSRRLQGMRKESGARKRMQH